MLLIGCAASGVIATSFQSPIAAVIFAIEIFSLDLTFAFITSLCLLPSLVSVITSFLVAGDQVLFTIDHNEGI
jgi:CIC family chloride channel protein